MANCSCAFNNVKKSFNVGHDYVNSTLTYAPVVLVEDRSAKDVIILSVMVVVFTQIGKEFRE